MTNRIDVARIDDDSSESLRFDVTVRAGGGKTKHRVTMSRLLFERLSGGAHTAEQCVGAAFRFLLDREPKEAILSRFDVSVISLYFPEFERELPKYLARS